MSEDGEVRQNVARHEKFDIEWYDDRDTGNTRTIMERAQWEVRKSFLLYGIRLFHFTVFTISTSECRLFVKVHHLIADAIRYVDLFPIRRRVFGIFSSLACFFAASLPSAHR